MTLGTREALVVTGSPRTEPFDSKLGIPSLTLAPHDRAPI
jgi:hypothetical protein